MGVLASTLIRNLLYLFALFINAIASIVMVRKLDAQEYAVYQTVVKRVTYYTAWLPGLYGLWLYRYTVKKVHGAVMTGLIFSFISGLIAAIVGYLVAARLAANMTTALLASFASAAMIFWFGLRRILDAVRPIWIAMLVLLHRLLYGALAVFLVYFMQLGIKGAFMAPAVSYILVSIVGSFLLKGCDVLTWPGWSRAAKIAIEWLRRSYITAIVNIAMFIQALDVLLIYAFSNAQVVAAFFAITNIFMFFTEAIRGSFTYLHGFVLSTKDYRSAVDAVRMTALLITPIIIYAALYPEYLIYLLNPTYLWAVDAAPLAAIASLVFIVDLGLLNLLAGLAGEDKDSDKGLARLYLNVFISSIVYLVVLAFGLMSSNSVHDDVIAWMEALLVRSLVLLVLLSMYALSSMRAVLLRSLVWALLGYPALASFAGLVFPPDGAPSPRFWETFWAMAFPAAKASLLYIGLVLLVDSWARKFAIVVLRRLRAGAMIDSWKRLGPG